MKKIALLAIAAIFWTEQGNAQFSQAIKDSVVKLLTYPGTRYSVSLSFKAEDYTAAGTGPDYQKMTRQQLNEKIKGDYTDASIYQALAAKSWYEENNREASARHLTEAAQKYQEWINAEPGNATPVDELLNMCISSKNYPPIPGILDYALPLFPRHLPLLQKAILYEQYVAKRYDRSRQLIDQALALDSLDLLTLAYLSGLQAVYQMEAMQQKKAIPYTGIPGLKAALNGSHSANTGLRHLHYFHQMFFIYMKAVSAAMNTESSSIKIFNFYTLTRQDREQIEEAENWMKQQIRQKGKNEAQLLNNLAVIQCIKKDYQAGAAYFDQAYRITDGVPELEGRIVCLTFMEAYAEVEKLVEAKVAASGSIPDYGSLLAVYDKYTRNKKAELALLKKLQEMEVKDPVKYQLLATGYLKTGQTGLLPEVLPLLGETERDDIMIRLVAAIINDKRSSAVVYLNNLLQLNPNDEDGLAIKKLASL